MNGTLTWMWFSPDLSQHFKI